MTAVPHYPGPLPLMPFGIPAGCIMAFAGKLTDKQDGPPADFETLIDAWGWLLCDGRMLFKNDYPVLYHVLGDQYNTGQEDEAHFSLPDYRGYFLRMTDMGAKRDPDTDKRKLPNGESSSEVGSIQEDALQLHQHKNANAKPGSPGATTGNGPMLGDALSGPPTDDLLDPPGTVRSSVETRAKNIYVYYIIKYI